MTLTNISNTLREGTAAIEMHQHHSLGTWCNGLLYQRVINLERLKARLYKDGLESVLRDRQDGGYESVGRHNDLIALSHPSHFHIGSKNEGERIQSVSHPDTMFRAYIAGIVLFKALRDLTSQIPASIYDTGRSLMYLVGMHCRDALKREIVYVQSLLLHNVHSYVS